MEQKFFWILIVIQLCSEIEGQKRGTQTSNGASGCTINVNQDLSDNQPLILRPKTTNFLYPEDKSGIVHLKLGQQVEICCTDKLQVPIGMGSSAIAKCVAGNKFKIDDYSFKFKQFSCENIPEHTARRTGRKCFNNSADIEVGFDLGKRFVKLFEVCHNEITEETYYTKYQLVPGSAGYQKAYPRPTFGKGIFFGKLNVNKLYTKNVQRKTIADLTRSSALASKYIEKAGDIYLARGHLAAKADFIYGSQQLATFYYINTAPQFQRFNAQNWEAVESSTQKYASNRAITVDVYTGTYGVLKLEDADGNLQEIFLYANGNDRKIPTPKLYYKILINNADKSGIVFIGVNNPHLTINEIEKDYIICPDISDKVGYINWKKTDIKRGYMYACELDKFMKVVKHLPKLKVNKLMV